jgi:predicted RNase H-like HicB family nuclease
MKPYIALVSKDPDSSYGIVFPDAPGCFSAADELDQIFEMANEALQGWSETMIERGFQLPRTRDLSEIKTDPEWVQEFTQAEMVIALQPPDAAQASAAA